MKIEQIYTGCLAQGAYYIESNGEAAIIDPLREVQPYIDLAENRGTKIKYVLETHFHADFVSGHLTLAEKTGAKIVYGPNANPSYEATIAKDGQEFSLGKTTIRVLHTPGHTMESTTYLLLDETGKKHAIFSGDTLFLGDVGRPDLAQKAATMTQEELAAILFKSLREKIMTLPNEVIVYPGHGAGSACGKNMSKETIGSLGEEKQHNYALRADMTETEFVKEVTDSLVPPPGYFPQNVKLNKEGYASIDKVLKQGGTPLSAKAFEAVANSTRALVLDVRHQSDFAKAHVPNSIFIGIDGGFAPWVGALVVDVQQPILLVVNEGRLEETITRLSRVGFDNVLGFLDGGIEAWEIAGYETDQVSTISASGFAQQMEAEKAPTFDVRKEGEYKAEHFDIATSTPLDFLNHHLEEFPTEGFFYLHCAGGYRSMIANSILKSRGIHNAIDVLGGFAAMSQTDLSKSAYICPSTLG